jgi:hypothetical protein
MFAEDIGLLPEDGFKNLLEKVQASPHGFPVLVSALWKEMATGTAYSALLFKEIACFNGGLFENTTALPLSAAQLAMLTDAVGTDWSAVELSIFGTLLVRALDPRERHKLGAEFTPRSYVERRQNRRRESPSPLSEPPGSAHRRQPPNNPANGCRALIKMKNGRSRGLPAFEFDCMKS